MREFLNSLIGQNEVPGSRYVLNFRISVGEYETMICVFMLSFPKVHKQCFSDDSEQNPTSNKMCSLPITGFPALAVGLLYSLNQQRKLISLTLCKLFIPSSPLPLLHQTFHFTVCEFY